MTAVQGVYMLKGMEKPKKWFRRGSGETLSFLPVLIIMLFLLLFMTAFIQYTISVINVSTSLETVGRSVVVCSSYDDAQDQAQRVAGTMIGSSSVSGVTTSVEYLDPGDDWKVGTYVKVTMNAHITTIEPFITSRDISKSILVTVEHYVRGSNVDLTGNSNAEMIFNYFRDMGFSDACAAAIVGNCVQESGCNPAAMNGTGKYVGIVQFNASNLYPAAEAQGADWTDLSFQLNYLYNDIAGQWTTWNDSITNEYIDAGYAPSGLSVEEWFAMTDPEEAAAAFCAYYERCYLSDACLDVRMGGAREAYNNYGGSK